DIGVIFDEAGIASEWTLKEVENAYKPFYKRWDSQKYYAYLEEFGLNVHTKVKDLSRGMTVKLMLATAFAHHAKLLILDEPTSGLDPASRDALMEMLQAYIEDGTKSVLFSTHITSDLEKVADYITSIDHGELFYTGTKDDLLEQYRRIKGGPNTYKGYEQWIIGLRRYTTGFEGMVRVKDLSHMNNSFEVEKLSIEDILVFINREGKRNDRKH
ncbi:MAG: ABC transporter ATP-binding protein, partial [Cellulosilyticaceae bacterium]